jgi:uncharacterized protein (DUF2141 family)
MKPNLPSNAAINESASVYFDFNPAIVTPTKVNTIDVTAPTSHVLPLAATQAATNFTVSWEGADAGSGIVTYDVYVSADGGPFQLWQGGVSTTSATFNGAAGKTYGFYSVATDAVGNQELAPAEPDATTTAGAQGGVLFGDLNGDGKVNVQDATASLRIAVGLLTPTEAQKVAGDVNKDGKLNPQDTTLILRKAVGVLAQFPAEG